MLKSKKLFFSIAIFGLFLLALEAGLRLVYFQLKAESPLAVITTARMAKNYYLRRLAKKHVFDYNLPNGIYNAFWTETGREIRSLFFKEYESHFAKLVDGVDSIDSKLIVLYIPSGRSWDDNLSLQECRPFFRELAQKYGAGFCDLTDEFTSLPIEAVTLLPEDAHMSRYGNLLVAEKLGKTIEEYEGCKAEFHFDKRPALFGDIEPNHNQIWDYNPSMLYRVQANSTGFRGTLEVTFPKKKQRILCLGDSQTFGVFLENKFLYTSILNRKYKDKEFFNAAKAGYGIVEELELFEERAKYIEPDITVLQVLDNDINGLFYFKKTDYSRKSIVFEPTKPELDFIEKVRELAGKK